MLLVRNMSDAKQLLCFYYLLLSTTRQSDGFAAYIFISTFT